MGNNETQAEYRLWDGNVGALTTDGSKKTLKSAFSPLNFFLPAEAWGLELWTPRSSLGDTRPYLQLQIIILGHFPCFLSHSQ